MASSQRSENPITNTEIRTAKMIVNKTGSGSYTFRATLPNSWVRKLELGEDARDLELSFDGEKIVIRKKS